MQPTVAIVLGQPSVRLPVLGQLHCRVLAVHYPDHLGEQWIDKKTKASDMTNPNTTKAQQIQTYLSPEFALVQVADGKHGLLRLGHLNQGSVLLVEQNLHTL